MSSKLYFIPVLLFLIADVYTYGQNTKARTHSSQAVKNSSAQSKPKVVKATSRPKTYRINMQWKTKSSVGMFSSFPTKTKKSSSQKFDHFPETNADEPSGTEQEKEAGIEKKEKQSFWKRLKLFKKE